MALLSPSPRGGRRESNFSGRATATWGTLLTASGVHGLGSKAQLIASTTFDATRVRVSFAESFVAVTVTNMLANIYVGAAAAEQVLIPNLYAGFASTIAQGQAPLSYEFPLRVPKGTRLSADLQSLVSGDVVYCRIELFNDGAYEWTGGKVETLGALTATSRGTQVVSGGASEGSWTAIGTTGRTYGYILPFCGGGPDTTVNTRIFSLDVGTGSAVMLGLEDFMYMTNTSEISHNTLSGGRFVDIPSGTALQARLQVGATDDTEAKSVLFYGVY